MKLPNTAQAKSFGNFDIASRSVTDYSDTMRDTTSAIIAKNLQRLLDERDMSALALAQKCNMGRSSVYDILQGRSQSPKVSTVAKLASALKVPLSEMFLTPDQVEAQSEMLRAYSQLPEEEQRRLAKVARAWMLD